MSRFIKSVKIIVIEIYFYCHGIELNIFESKAILRFEFRDSMRLGLAGIGQLKFEVKINLNFCDL